MWNGRHHELVGRYGLYISNMRTDIFPCHTFLLPRTWYFMSNPSGVSRINRGCLPYRWTWFILPVFSRVRVVYPLLFLCKCHFEYFTCLLSLSVFFLGFYFFFVNVRILVPLTTLQICSVHPNCMGNYWLYQIIGCSVRINYDIDICFIVLTVLDLDNHSVLIYIKTIL